MKRLFIFCLVSCAIQVSALAGDYDFLAFRNNDGTEGKLSVNQLKITFSNGQLVAVNNETNQTFSLSNLFKMYFTNSTVTNIEGRLPTDENAEVEVFTTSGLCMGRFESLEQAKQTLSTGVYIVRQSDRTYKTAVK